MSIPLLRFFLEPPGWKEILLFPPYATLEMRGCLRSNGAHPIQTQKSQLHVDKRMTSTHQKAPKSSSDPCITIIDECCRGRKRMTVAAEITAEMLRQVRVAVINLAREVHERDLIGDFGDLLAFAD